jgi:hypothetical protein
MCGIVDYKRFRQTQCSPPRISTPALAMATAGFSETSVNFYHETKLRHTFTVTAVSISNIKDRESSLNQAITASFYIPYNSSFTIILSIDASKSALNEVQIKKDWTHQC